MATQIRTVIPRIMEAVQILFQSGEITTEEKRTLCQECKRALATNETETLHRLFSSKRYGTMFPEIIDECVQLLG